MAAPALTLLWIVLALAAAWPLRRALEAEAAQRIGRMAEDLALKVLLPLVVVDALAHTGLHAGLRMAVALGLALPLLCLGIGMLLHRARRDADPGLQQRNARLLETAFLAASFGGGNRGTALLLLLTAGSAGQIGLLAAFALVDLGNLLCLLFLVTPLLRRAYGPAATGATPAGNRWRTLATSHAGMLVLVVGGGLMLQRWAPASTALLEATGPLRKAALTALVFLALALRWRAGAPLRGLLNGLAAFGLIRSLAALALLTLAAVLPTPLLFSALVLLALPPSSLLPPLVAQTGADAASRDYIDRFATATNVLYLVVLLLAGVAAAGLAWSG